jgi:hypothetical protein
MGGIDIVMEELGEKIPSLYVVYKYLKRGGGGGGLAAGKGGGRCKRVACIFPYHPLFSTAVLHSNCH